MSTIKTIKLNYTLWQWTSLFSCKDEMEGGGEELENHVIATSIWSIVHTQNPIVDAWLTLNSAWPVVSGVTHIKSIISENEVIIWTCSVLGAVNERADRAIRASKRGDKTNNWTFATLTFGVRSCLDRTFRSILFVVA